MPAEFSVVVVVPQAVALAAPAALERAAAQAPSVASIFMASVERVAQAHRRVVGEVLDLGVLSLFK